MFPSIYFPSYAVRPSRYWLVCDKPKDKVYATHSNEVMPHAGLILHLKENDYITTLATYLRFFEETIVDPKSTPEMRQLQFKTIKELIADLLYLNEYYTIAPKVRSDGNYDKYR